MKRRWLTALVIVFGVLGVLGALAATVGYAQTAPAKRSVVLELGLPNGFTPQLKIVEGDTGSVELPQLGKFGFVPAIRDAAGSVVVDVYDLQATPNEKLSSVEAPIGGDAVDSRTSPAFAVRVLRVVTP
jgi:hypothetical protein